MRLHRSGRACHGLLTLSVDGKVVVPGLRSTRPVWFGDEALCQAERADGTWYIAAVNVDTGAVREVDKDPATEVDAGGGVWAARTARGVRSNVHPVLPLAALRGVGVDGCLGYSRDYQDGTGLIMRDAHSGATIEIAGGQPIAPFAHIVAFGVAAWVSGSRLYTHGTPSVVTVPEPIFQPRLVQLTGGQWWVLYHTQTRLLFHPIDSPIGYVVRAAPDTFAPDVIELAPGVVRIVWAATEAEGAIQYRALDIDTATAPRRPLTQATLAPIATPMWHGGYFAWSKRYGTDTTDPCNCTVLAESGLNPPVPVVIGDTADGGEDLIAEWAGARWQRVVAIHVAREREAGLLTAAVAETRHRIQSRGLPQRPVLAYAGDTPPVNVGADWIGVQAYPNPGETADEVDHRVRNTLQRVAGRDVALIVGTFDRRSSVTGPGPIAEDVLLQLLPRYAEIARSLGPRCKALLRFAVNRPGGTRDHPALRPWLELVNGAVKAPALPPNVIGTGRATIDSFESKVVLGRTSRAVARVTGTGGVFLRWRSRVAGASGPYAVQALNRLPDVDHHFAFPTVGRFEIGVDLLDAAGTVLDQTTAPRVVTVRNA